PAHLLKRVLQFRELPGALDHGHVAIHHGHAGGVVPAVLQPAEALDQDGKGLIGPHVPNDAAHKGSMVPPGQAIPAATRSAMSRAWRFASSSVGASTITRTSGSVRDARP